MARSATTVFAQAPTIAIDRTVGDLVVLPAEANATVTGTSTLQPNTDFLVRVFSQEQPALDVETGTVVTDDGTWSATVDLSDAVDGQAITVEAVVNGDTVASAGGMIGPLSASVRFDDQRIPADGRRVVITGARLEVGGFVVVTDGADGPILGVTEYLDGGMVHSDVPVSFTSSISGAEQLVATAWLDVDGDRLFDVGIDRPYPAGNPVSDPAIVEVTTPATDTPEPTDTDTAASGSGLDVAAAVAGGAAGAIGFHRAFKRIEREVRKRRDGNRPPVAQFLHVPERPRPGIPVLFDGTLSFDPDPDDSVRRYEWSIGDATARGPRHVHLFGAAGESDVELRVQDEAGAEGRHTRTVTVEAPEGRLELAAVRPAVSGDEPPRDEYVVFRNAGDDALDVGGWSVRDAARATGGVVPGRHSFRFPAGFELAAGESVSIHTGSAPAEEARAEVPADRHLSWNAPEPILDGRSGHIVVVDGDGNPALAARYERTGVAEYDVEDVEPRELEGWFEPIPLGEPLQVPFLGVTVESRIGVAAIENAIEFVAAGLYVRGSAAFVRSWGLVAAFLVVALLTWLLSTQSGLLRPSFGADGPIALLVGVLTVTAVGLIAWGLDVARRLLGDRLG